LAIGVPDLVAPAAALPECCWPFWGWPAAGWPNSGKQWPRGPSRSAVAALHVPVLVHDTRLQTTPAPAIVLIGIDLGGQMRLDEVTLEFTAPSLWRAIMSGQSRWGDVVISPQR